NLFCELPNITSVLRKFVALGLITGLYECPEELSNLDDKELSMLQFLFDQKDKKELNALMLSFINYNKSFFEAVLVECQASDAKMRFEDSNLSDRVVIALPKSYPKFNALVSKANCKNCDSISKEG